MTDLEELNRIKHSATLAAESYRELRNGNLSPGVFDSRWERFHKDANPQTVLALIEENTLLKQVEANLSELHNVALAEIDRLRSELEEARRDAERFAWAVENEDNAESLYAMVMNHGPYHIGTIRHEVDASRQQKGN